jgi:hypothetical protein
VVVQEVLRVGIPRIAGSVFFSLGFVIILL